MRVEPAQVDQLLRAPLRPQGDQGQPASRCWRRASTPRRAPPSAEPSSTPTPPSSGWQTGEKVILVRVETTPGRRPRHGRGPGHPDRPRRRHVARRRRRPPDRQALRRRLRRAASWTTAPRAPSPAVDGTSVRRGRLDLHRRLHRRGVRRRRCRRSSPLRGAAELQHDPRLGRRDPPHGRLGQRGLPPSRPPRPAATAPQGIGLCRTEHMFMEGERLPIVQSVILVASVATRPRRRPRRRGAHADEQAPSPVRRGMAKLEVLQQGDFEGIFKAMDGLPVVVRLIDPPLHEFLPNLEELLVKVTRAEMSRRVAEPRTTRSCSRPSSRCTSRTRCSACAAAASAS